MHKVLLLKALSARLNNTIDCNRPIAINSVLQRICGIYEQLWNIYSGGYWFTKSQKSQVFHNFFKWILGNVIKVTVNLWFCDAAFYSLAANALCSIGLMHFIAAVSFCFIEKICYNNLAAIWTDCYLVFLIVRKSSCRIDSAGVFSYSDTPTKSFKL